MRNLLLSRKTNIGHMYADENNLNNPCKYIILTGHALRGALWVYSRVSRNSDPAGACIIGNAVNMIRMS